MLISPGLTPMQPTWKNVFIQWEHGMNRPNTLEALTLHSCLAFMWICSKSFFLWGWTDIFSTTPRGHLTGKLKRSSFHHLNKCLCCFSLEDSLISLVYIHTIYCTLQICKTVGSWHAWFRAGSNCFYASAPVIAVARGITVCCQVVLQVVRPSVCHHILVNVISDKHRDGNFF